MFSKQRSCVIGIVLSAACIASGRIGLAFGAESGAASPSAPPIAVPTQSREYLQRQLDDADDTKTSDERELKILQGFLPKLQDSATNLLPETPEQAATQKTHIDALAAAANSILEQCRHTSTTQPSTTISLVSLTAIADFEAAFSNFNADYINLTQTFYTSHPWLWPTAYQRKFPGPEVSDVLQQVPDDNEQAPFYTAFQKVYYLNQLLMNQYSTQGMTAAQLQTELKDVMDELHSTTDFSKAIAAENAKIADRCRFELDAVNGRVADLKQAIAEAAQSVDQANGKLSALDVAAAGGAAAVSEKLIMAVFLMLGAIVVCFFALPFFPLDMGIAIVNQRTLIELLSMAFLLLTIILLGTARLLDTQVLAALLGTIAGYIFGRKDPVDRRTSDSKPGEGKPTPAVSKA